MRQFGYAHQDRKLFAKYFQNQTNNFIQIECLEALKTSYLPPIQYNVLKQLKKLHLITWNENIDFKVINCRNLQYLEYIS